MMNIRRLAISIVWVMLSVNFIHAQDLSTYREFQFGMNLPTIAKKVGLEPSAAKVIHARPALIQELNWQAPFSPRSSPQADPVGNIVFSFYNGELFRIVVNYDRSKTQGLTTEDLVEAISAKYGPAKKLASEITISLSEGFSHSEVVIARWEDPQYSFNLFRTSYNSTFGMIAFSKRVDALARAATIEAIRLDTQEAPQREIERQKKLEEENLAAEEKARLANKPNFRP
jgi:hypothetical protein